VSRRAGFTFLTQRMNYSPGQAGSDVAAARALDPTGAGFDLLPTEDLAGSGGDPTPCDTVLGADDGLPLMGAALAAGLVTRSHVDVAVRCLARVPQHLANRVDEHGVSGRRRIDAFLTRQSLAASPTTTHRLVHQLLEELDPDGNDRFDPLAHTRRSLTFTKDSTGMTLVRGQLDPATAAVLQAGLQHFRSLTAHRPGTGEDGQGELAIRDVRSRGQRNVDALAAMCEAALRAHYPTMAEGGPGRQPAAPLVRVIITASPEQAAAARRTTADPLDDDGLPMRPPGWRDEWSARPSGSGPPGSGTPGSGTPGSGPPGSGRSEQRCRDGVGLGHEAETGDPLSTPTLGRLLCDAELQTVVLGEDRTVLDMGRATRLATPLQRTALVARDRGCVVPQCGMPPSACDAHHVTWWRDGGPTDVDNLALLCGRHHTLIHSGGGWVLQMRGGVPHVVAPSWIDPTRTPRRNTVFDAEVEARRLGRTVGRQLRLPLH